MLGRDLAPFEDAVKIPTVRDFAEIRVMSSRAELRSS